MRLHLGCSDDFKSNYLNVDCTPPPADSVAMVANGCATGRWKTPDGFMYQSVDLNRPWPWEDSTVDEIVANDVFEHIGNLHWGYCEFEMSYQLPDGSWQAARLSRLRAVEPVGESMRYVCADIPGKIWALNEAHRVLKPGGMLRFTVPAVCLADGRVNPGAFADPTHRTFWTIDDCFYFGEQWNTPDMERGRLGAAYGITALFRFPPMVDCGARGWKGADYRGSVELLQWKLEEANGRAKIRAVIEAIK